MPPMCLKSAVLRPYDSFTEQISRPVKVDLTVLLDNLENIQNLLTEIVTKEEKTEPLLEGAKHISNQYFESSYFKMMRFKTFTDWKKCKDLGGELIQYTHDSPRDIYTVFEAFKQRSTILHAININGSIVSPSGTLMGSVDSSQVKHWLAKGLGLLKVKDPNQDLTVNLTFAIMDPSDASSGGIGYPGFCEFKQRYLGSEVSDVIMDIVAEARELVSSLVSFQESLARLVDDADQKRVSGYEPAFDIPLNDLTDMTTMLKAFRYPSASSTFDDITELKLVVDEIKDVIYSYRISGDSLMFKENDGKWTWLKVLHRQGSMLTVDMKSEDTQKVNVYLIDSLLIGKEQPYREIDQRYFITRGKLNYTSSVAPVRHLCDFDSCSVTHYGDMDSVCAASLMYGGHACPLKESQTIRVLEEEGCDQRFAYLLSSEPVTVDMTCRADIDMPELTSPGGNEAIPEGCSIDLNALTFSGNNAVLSKSNEFFKKWNGTNVSVLVSSCMVALIMAIFGYKIRSRCCPQIDVTLPKIAFKKNSKYEPAEKEDIEMRGGAVPMLSGNGVYLSSAPRRTLGYI